MLRGENARSIIVAVLFLELALFVIPSVLNLNLVGGMAAVLPAVLGELTNTERQALNLPTLSVNPLLTEAAEMKAKDMAEKGYFAHTSPEGRTPWYWIEATGYRYQYAGENLAVNFRDSKDVTEAWLKSPTHRANIVKGKYTEMGTGIAKGEYNGRPAVFVAQVYANPLPGAQNVVQKQAPAVKTPEPVAANVLGAEVAVEDTAQEVVIAETKAVEKTVESPSLWHKILASPRYATNLALIALLFIIALALIIYIAVRMHEHEEHLVTNGLATLAIIGALLVGNYYFSFNSMQVSESYDYALEDTI